MSVTVARLRAESLRLREQGWSYRRIARQWQATHHLNARVAFRLAHGWTQEEAARRWNERWPGSGPPKTGKTFSYWESWPAKGGRAPSTQVFERLAELYLCRPGDLLDGRDYGELDDGDDGLAVPAAAQPGCTCRLGGGEPAGWETSGPREALEPLGLHAVASALASPSPGPSADSVDRQLSRLLAGWVRAA